MNARGTSALVYTRWENKDRCPRGQFLGLLNRLLTLLRSSRPKSHGGRFIKFSSHADTYDHREWKTGLPVRSAVLKPLESTRSTLNSALFMLGDGRASSRCVRAIWVIKGDGRASSKGDRVSKQDTQGGELNKKTTIPLTIKAFTSASFHFNRLKKCHVPPKRGGPKSKSSWKH
ncbi:hypothetical protein GX50_05603 [[Emmonsia] crescens]|uniref:Uncharacterized protein n=1 Tax=[Emmonsia] crescens TaxID=73230 RepID=A0A2B7ZF34_9EURO|nr:hypothetical protein GX50_05603 [Emmonsia crescens]